MTHTNNLDEISVRWISLFAEKGCCCLLFVVGFLVLQRRLLALVGPDWNQNWKKFHRCLCSIYSLIYRFLFSCRLSHLRLWRVTRAKSCVGDSHYYWMFCTFSIRKTKKSSSNLDFWRFCLFAVVDVVSFVPSQTWSQARLFVPNSTWWPKCIPPIKRIAARHVESFAWY